MNILKKSLMWVVLYIIFLEIFLRLGGFLFIWQQDINNRSGLQKTNDYKVLCVGDSMTVIGDYPSRLEEILNSKQNKVHFVVINKGIPHADLYQILDHLKGYLDEYHPHMVVSMAGLVPQDPSQAKVSNSPLLLLKKSEVFRLIKSLGSQAFDGLRSFSFYKKRPPFQIDEKQRIIIDSYLHPLKTQIVLNPAPENHTRLHTLRYFMKTMELIDRRIMVKYYLNAFDFEKAIPSLFQLLKICPNTQTEMKVKAYDRLVESYTALNKKDQLVFIYQHAIINFPNNDWGYAHLGDLLFEEGNFNLAKKLFTREISANNQVPDAYDKLAVCFIKTGDVSSAKKILELGIKTVPLSNARTLYYRLANLLFDANETKEAEEILERFTRIDHDNPDALKNFRCTPDVTVNLYELLIKAYDLNHESVRSALLKKDIDQYKQQQSNIYIKISKILEDRNIPFIVVQYPIKDLKILKETFPPSKKIYFVDNESVFKQAVAQANYFVYFVDHVGGEFGHCTLKGATLLAENIAKTILDITRPNQ